MIATIAVLMLAFILALFGAIRTGWAIISGPEDTLTIVGTIFLLCVFVAAMYMSLHTISKMMHQVIVQA